MLKGTTKLRVPDFKLRNARRMFAAGADRVEFDSATGKLIGYKTGKGETPPTEPANSDTAENIIRQL